MKSEVLTLILVKLYVKRKTFSSKTINWDSFDLNMRALVSRILCIPYFLSWKVRIWLPESVSILRRITGQIRGFRGDEALYSLCRGMFPLYIELQAHWDHTEMTIPLCYFFKEKD